MALHVQGNYHQANDRYEGRGRQCTAIAMTALAYHQIKNVDKWESSDVDLILEYGDNVYMKATGKSGTTVTMLLPSEIVQTVNMCGKNVTFNVEESNSGVLGGHHDESAEILKVIEHVKETAIITFGQIFSSYSVGLIRYSEGFYIFDSHSRDQHGLCVADGAACVTKHESVGAVSTFIRGLSQSVGMGNGCFFDIVNVNVLLEEGTSSNLRHGTVEVEDEDEDDIPLLRLLHQNQVKQTTLESDSDDEPLAQIKRRGRMDAAVSKIGLIVISISDLDSHNDALVREEMYEQEVSTLYDYDSCLGTSIEDDSSMDVSSTSTNTMLTSASPSSQDTLLTETPSLLLPLNEEERRSRKRSRNVSEWKVNVRKRRRNCGEEYTNRSGGKIKRRELKAGCGNMCRNKCQSRLTLEERSTIFHNFWKIGCITGQRNYLCKVIQKKGKKTQMKPPSARRGQTYIFNLDLNERRITVCKKMFLDTLNISQRMVSTAMEKITDLGTSGGEGRGRHLCRGKPLEKDQIRRHINSFPRVESHYSRKDSKREYLEASLSLQKMYDMYVEKRKGEGCFTPASSGTYRNIFNYEFNISFHKRMKDRCDVCAAHEHRRDSHDDDEYERHINLKEESRAYRDNIKDRLKHDSKMAAAVFDLEEVLTTPSSGESSLYYKRKLNTYNLTIYDYRNGQGYCHVWVETEALRGSNEISSCVYSYLQRLRNENKDIKKVILFSDSCGGQNRNKNFLSMLWFALQSLNFDMIEHVFFVTGHSQNEGDSMHSTIERSSRHVPVYIPGQWAQLMRTAKRKLPHYIVAEFDRNNFFDFKKIAENHKNFELDTNKDRVRWLKVKRFRLTSDCPSVVKVFYDYTEEFKELNLSQKLRKLHESPNARFMTLENVTKDPYPLNKDKYADLLNLCDKNIIPPAHHEYFKSLPHVD